MKKFPKDFKWGVSTSSYQIEGGNNNSDWALWEEKRGIEKAGIACDSYRKYDKDIEALEKLNVNAYRFSIEWSRIEPKDGEWNLEALEYYKDLIKKLKSKGIEPFVTLFHFSLPLWISEQKGFENKKIIQYFKRYTEFIVENLGADVNFWITINEPVIFASLGYLDAEWPPGKRSYRKYLKVIKNLEQSHIISYKKINEVYKKYGWSKPAISMSFNNSNFEAKDFLSRIYIGIVKYIFNYSVINKVINYLDFIGLNVYFYNEIEFAPFKDGNLFFRKVKHDNLEKADVLGWEIYPKIMYNLVTDIYKRYKKDIYITENGISDTDDSRREKYIKDNLRYLLKSIDEGASVKGYFHWTLSDNFEWVNGYKAKFGLCYIDSSSERVLKKSGEYYAKIAQTNSLN